MPDFTQDNTLQAPPQVTQQPLPDDYKGGTGTQAPTDPFSQFVADGNKNLPAWATPNAVRMQVPVQTRLDQTLKYTDPNLGFDPTDKNLEDEYANTHPWKTFGNNILQTGARFLGAATEAIATIPLALNAAINGDVSKLYDNDLTNGIDGWLKSLDNTLPIFQTNYERDHPVMKYLNPLKLTSFTGAIGGAINNLGFVAGAIGGSLVEDAAITAVTGGAGLFPALSSNISLITKLGRAGRALAAEPEEAVNAVRLASQAETLSTTLPAIQTEGALLNGVTNQAVRSTGENIISQDVNAADIIASQKANEIKSAINSNANYYKIRDAVKYNLALLSSATSMGAFQAVDVYKQGVDQLSQDYFNKNGMAPQGKDLQDIISTSKGSANISLGANVALAYLTSRLNFGSLFKPTTQAFDEAITGVGSTIAKNKIAAEATPGFGINYKIATTAPETTIGKILLNAQKLGAKASISGFEGLQFGAQSAINSSALDYNLRKYDAQGRGQVVDYMQSFLKGIDNSFATDAGFGNVMMGFVIGAFGTPIVHKFMEGKGQLSAKEQMQRNVDILNSSTLRGTMENAIQEASVQTGLATDHKQAVDQQDKFNAKNIKTEMLYNWATSGIKSNSYSARMEELDAVRGLEGKSFTSYWGREDTPENRQNVNQFIDDLQTKADAIKDNYTKVDRLTKNPYDAKKSPQDYQTFDSYKDALALNLSKSGDYQNRLKAVRDALKKLTPGLDVQNAVDLTSIGGMRNIARKLTEATGTLGKQMQTAQQAGTDADTLKEMHQKHQALQDLFTELQPLITGAHVDEHGNILDANFDGKKYIDVLQKLYDLHNGGSYTANAYLDNQKRIADGNTIHIDETNKVKDTDGLAEALQNLQDVYKLSEANLNTQRYYNFLRQGRGAEDYMSGLKSAILARLQAFTGKDGEIKTPQQIQDEIEEDTRFDITEPDNIEEATKEQRDSITNAAKKTITGEPLTTEEQHLTEQQPSRFAHEVKVQAAVKQKLDDRFGANTPQEGDPIATETTRGVKLGDVFGMFSQDKGNAVKFRTNLYNAIFKSGVNNVFSNLSATYEPVDVQNPVFIQIPNTGLYRSTFNENVKVFHNGLQVGVLRPADSLWLDNTGTRSVYDMTEPEFKQVTGNETENFKDFMDGLRSYQTKYNSLKADMLAHPNEEFTHADINKHFDLEVNTGISSQNRYNIQPVGNKFNVTDPNGAIVKTASTKEEATNWIQANNNKLSRFDTLLKDLHYKPEGTALISFTDVVTGGRGGQISSKSTEPIIANKEEFTPTQLAKLETFLEQNADFLRQNVNRYGVIVPVNGEYLKKGILFARNADTTSDDRAVFFKQVKDAADGTLNEQQRQDATTDLNGKFFIANNDRTVKQTFITTKFTPEGDMQLSINNPSLSNYKEITIPKEEIQQVKTYSDLMHKLQGNINAEAQKDPNFAKLRVDLTEDSLKRQIPADDKINKLSQVEDAIKVATTPDVFKNFNINFNPKGEGTSTPEDTAPKEPTSILDINKKPSDAITREYQIKRNQLNKAFNDSLTPAEKAIKDAIQADRALATNTIALLKAANAKIEDLRSYSKKATDYNEQFGTLHNIQKQKIENLTNISKPIFARTKAGIETIAKELFGLNDEQAKATAEVYDLNAKAWAARTGKPIDAYYKQLGFKSQLESDAPQQDIINQTPAIQKVIDYLKLQPKQIGSNVGGYTAGENGLVGQALADRVGAVIKEQNLQDYVGARWDKTHNVIQFFPKDPNGVLFQAANKTTEAFYSPLERFVETNKQSTFTPEQVLGQIKTLPQSEIDAIDLKDFLKDKTKVTKQELLNYIADNKVNIEVKTLSGPEDEDTGSGARYYDYTLPGKKDNYREVLLTLPNEVDAKINKLYLKYNLGEPQYVIRSDRTMQDNLYDLYSTNKGLYDKFQAEVKKIKENNGFKYRSSHFSDYNNIVAHLRLTDRTTPDGKKILFVEEQQSDWAREGRTKGYKTNSPNQELYNDLLNKESRAEGLLNREMRLVRNEKGQDISIHDELVVGNKNIEKLWNDYNNIRSERFALLPGIQKANEGVADMPFKNDKWVELATKKAIQIAAQEGYDGIAWVNGKQTADRYSLDKQIKYIDYSPNEDDGQYHVVAEDSNGNTILNRFHIAPEEIEKYLGKDVAKRIVNGEGVKGTTYHSVNQRDKDNVKRLQGDDLKIEAGWARNLYDKQIPKLAEKYSKQFSGKTTQFKIDHTKPYEPFMGDDAYSKYDWQKYDKPITKENVTIEDGAIFINDEYYEPRGTSTLSDDIIRQNTAHFYNEEILKIAASKGKDTTTSNQFGIEITPEMRDKTQQIPLFQNEKGAYNKLTNTIYALTNPDVTTPLHELAHSWEPLLTSEEKQHVLDWTKHDSWTTETSERFANGFEKYLADGKAPTTALQALFNKFAQWMQGVIQKVKSLFGNDFELNNSMKSIYAKMLNSEHISEAAPVEEKPTHIAPTTPLDYEKNIDDSGTNVLVKDDAGNTLGTFKYLNEAKDFINKHNSGLQESPTPPASVQQSKGIRIGTQEYLDMLKEQVSISQEHVTQSQTDLDALTTELEKGKNMLKAINALKKAGKHVNDSDLEDWKANVKDYQDKVNKTKKELKTYSDRLELYDGYVKNFHFIDYPKEETTSPIPELQAIATHIDQPLAEGENTDYGKVSEVQKDLKSGYYEQQIKDGKLTTDQVKEILKSAGLDPTAVEGIKFRIDNSDLIKAFKEGIPKGINVSYLRSDLNNAIKDGRFGQAIRNGDIDVEKAKEILKYFNKSETPFADDFAAVEKQTSDNIQQQSVNEQPLNQEEQAFIDALKANIGSLKGSLSDGLKLAIESGDYRSAVDFVKSQLIDNTRLAKQTFDNEDIYKAFKKLTGAEDNTITSQALIDKHTAEPEPPTQVPQYVTYKEKGPDDTLVERYGRVVDQSGLLSTIEDARGNTIDRLTSALKPATKDQFDSQKTHVPTAKYIRRDKVIYGANKKQYTIVDSEVRAKEADLNKPLSKQQFDTFYNTEEGLLINESGIHGLARDTPADKEFKILVEHEARFRVIKRISGQFEKVFPQIKTDIGYFDFDAPARFNKGRVEINIGYGDKRFTQEEINAANLKGQTPWLKREAVAHEFMHPFIVALESSNSPLYDSLAKEILNHKDILDKVDGLIKNGTYKDTDRTNEALAQYLGHEVTKAFNRDGTLNTDYVAERKTSLVQRFVQWLNDIFDYLTGKKKLATLDEFVKNTNADLATSRENIRKIIKTIDPLNELYTKQHHSDLKNTIGFVKRTLGDAMHKDGSLDYANYGDGRKALADALNIKDPKQLDNLIDVVSDYITQKPTGRFEFIQRLNTNDGVEFDQTDPEHIKVYVDPLFADQLAAPSVMLQYGKHITDNKAAEEFQNLVQRSYYKRAVGTAQPAEIGVKSLNPLMHLQDISDYVVKQLADNDVQLKYDTNELRSIDELTAYMDLEEPEAKRIRAGIIRRLAQLKDTADVRLNNETLKTNYNVLRRLNLDENDTDFVLKYVQQAAVSVNLAWRKFNELRQDLKDPTLTKAKFNRLNKDLDVVKQLAGFYDDFSSLYNRYDDMFSKEDLQGFNKASANLQRLRDDMNETSINLAVKWFMPYVEKHNQFIQKEGFTDPKYLLTENDLYNNLKYGTTKDTNFITFNLGATVTSRDPVNAVFSNIVADMLSVNNVNIVNDSFDINEGYAKFLRDKGIKNNDSKAQVKYYKDNYLRQATVKVNHYDEATGKYTDKYIQKSAFHQEFYFDKYEQDLDAEKAKYANPRNSDEAEQFNEQLTQWKKDHLHGKAEQYRNNDYTKLQNDAYFKLLEKHYNDANDKYGEFKLQYGIIPQRYDVNLIERLKNYINDVKVGDTRKDKFNIIGDKARIALAGLKKDQTKINLDDTIYRSVNSNLNKLKEDSNLDYNLHNTLVDFLTEATNYGSLKEVQYNAENLRALIEGNIKFSMPGRKIGKEDFEAKIRQPIQLRKAKERLAELQNLKDTGQTYDEDLYNTLKEKVAKGIQSTNLWDKFAGTIKPSTTNRLNEQLRQFINDTFYGESVEEMKVGNISLNKAAHYLSMYTSINNMAFNTVAGVSNVVIGDVQMLIEGHGGKYYNKAELAKATADYIKNIPQYMSDLQNPIKSKDTQLSFLLDAIQGEILDEFGNRISGNIAKRMFNTSSLFMFTSLGEHQIQVTGMKAMLLGRKVETLDGQKMSLYDAYTKDANGRYSLRTDLKDFNEDDLQHFIRQLHNVNRQLNGNYSALHKGTLQRKWYGTLALKFRKYIYEAFRARYASEHMDYEKNTVENGYLRYFFNDYLYKNFKNLTLRQATDFKGENLKPNQKYAVRKATMEIGIYAAISVITAGLMSGTQKKDLTPAEKALLLYSLRLRNDLGMYHASVFSELKQQTQSPTASLQTIMAVNKTLGQLFQDPTATYAATANGNTKGDSKLASDARKLIPILSKFPINLDNKLSYFNLANQNVVGINKNQNSQ